MFEMTPAQAALVLAIVGFFPLFFQMLTLVTAQPIIAPILDKISKFILEYVEWLTPDLIKRGVAWGLAVLVIALTGIPFFPTFPTAVVFNADWFILLFTWATNMLFSLSSLLTTLQGFFHYFWKSIFGGSLSSKKIENIAASNK